MVTVSWHLNCLVIAPTKDQPQPIEILTYLANWKVVSELKRHLGLR